jgi:hypothetical protein
MAEQSARRLYQVRGKLYELLANCIPPELLLRTLLVELLKKLDDELKVTGGPWGERAGAGRFVSGCWGGGEVAQGPGAGVDAWEGAWVLEGMLRPRARAEHPAVG